MDEIESAQSQPPAGAEPSYALVVSADVFARLKGGEMPEWFVARG
jgi:hypothetical protein